MKIPELSLKYSNVKYLLNCTIYFLIGYSRSFKSNARDIKIGKRIIGFIEIIKVAEKEEFIG